MIKDSARKMNVLVVDDQRISRTAIERTLHEEGYNVLTCTDGKQALEIIRTNNIRLAIVDWVMPEMDGISLSRRIRKMDSKKYIYIIMTTSKDKKRDLVEAMNAGVDDFISKPFNKGEFLSRIKVGLRLLKIQDKLVKSQRELIKLIKEDPLTTLLNRRALLDEAIKETDRAGREGISVSGMMIDIDNFSRINEKHGQESGDAALLETARRIKSVCRPYDRAGRYGGEEFLVVLPGANAKDAGKVAERIRKSISSKPYPYAGLDLNVTVSIGISSMLPVKQETERQVEELIKRTETALAKAKKDGKDRIAVITAVS